MQAGLFWAQASPALCVFDREAVQWVESEKWLLVLDSRAPKHKLEVMRLGQAVHNRSNKMNMKKLK
jgi:hypothetical protein